MLEDYRMKAAGAAPSPASAPRPDDASGRAVLEAIVARRTIRRYAPRQLEPAVLRAILDAGLYAPTGGGRQTPVLLVSQDAAANDRLGRLNRALFGRANSDGIHFVSATQRSIADDDALPSAFYGAPTVVTLFAPRGWAYGIHDCTSVAVTMGLAAWALGVGSCYVSRAEQTFDSPLGRELMDRAGIGEDYVARVHLCLGYPEGEPGEPKPRRAGRIRFV